MFQDDGLLSSGLIFMFQDDGLPSRGLIFYVPG